MLAKIVNHNAGVLDNRGVFEFFASKLAPTAQGKSPCYRDLVWLRDDKVNSTQVYCSLSKGFTGLVRRSSRSRNG